MGGCIGKHFVDQLADSAGKGILGVSGIVEIDLPEDRLQRLGLPGFFVSVDYGAAPEDISADIDGDGCADATDLEIRPLEGAEPSAFDVVLNRDADQLVINAVDKTLKCKIKLRMTNCKQLLSL